jgi:hypothetical protein
MDRHQLLFYLSEADAMLREWNATLVIYVSGGANMCIYQNARHSTHDIDAYVKDDTLFEELRVKMSARFNLPVSWINASANLFVTPKMLDTSEFTLDFNNLKVYFLNTESMLVLKVAAGREDSFDLQDAAALIKKLDIHSHSRIMELVDEYMPGWNNPYVAYFAQKALTQALAEDIPSKTTPADKLP